MSEDFNRTSLGEIKLTSPENEQFKVFVSRGKVGIVAFALSAMTICIAYLVTRQGQVTYLELPLIFLMACISICFAGISLRRRPICVIDAQGITDYGFVSHGYGLISWQNVEGVTKFWDRTGVSLVVKVNNFNQLLARRNILIRPILLVTGSLGKLAGGEILLPISYSSTDAESVRKQILRYSEMPHLAPPVKPLAQQGRQLLVSLRIAVVMVVTVVLLAVAYWLWQQLQTPTLQILGLDNRVQVGKQVWLQQYEIENYGRDTTGMHVEFSGRALDTNFIKNPRVLIEYETKSQIASSFVVMKTREIVPLVQVKKNLWAGDSKRAFLAHKDNMMLSGLHLYSNKFTSAIGWWTDVLGPRLEIHLFADVPKIGDESLSLKVVPTEYPDSAATVRSRFTSTTEKNFGSGPILSEGVPKDFLVTAYPDSYILWLSAVELKLDSAAAPTAIAAYYKEELNRKSWKTTLKNDKPNQTLVVDGLKDKDHITVTINLIPHHTPIDIFLWLNHQ
jgi:hypothetical protein